MRSILLKSSNKHDIQVSLFVYSTGLMFLVRTLGIYTYCCIFGLFCIKNKLTRSLALVVYRLASTWQCTCYSQVHLVLSMYI